ncbi:MAG: RNA polymerase subunit sigma-70, partial [Mesorhizobium sp.]|uniref:DUF6596 domain-containing protein n=1 Tax=Mesorhizobium sp. TaxID=1871066 RepID=UPI00120D8A7A
VLEAIYATFAEGWSDPAGTETRRRNLATEGIWLGRLVASLIPDEPETLGLLALMLFAEARRTARRSPDGDFVPLAEQDVALWDDKLIDEAEALLRRAAIRGTIGRYQLEAAVQSAHTARRRSGRTDWAAINRAVAIAEAEGAAEGLAALDEIGGDKRVGEYQPYWAARAELLARLGRTAEAAEAYDRAIGLERDPALRHFLQAERGKLVRN